MRQDLGKVPGKPPSLPAPTCSEHTEPSAESGSLQSPCEGQPGISCLKNRRQASTSHLLLAEVQFHVGSEGPGSVSTEASLPWPHCPGLGGHMVSCPPGIQGARSTDPEGRDSQAPTLGLSHLPRACCVQMGVAEAESDCGCCLDRWAQCGLLGVSGPIPSSRSGSPASLLLPPSPRKPAGFVSLPAAHTSGAHPSTLLA